MNPTLSAFSVNVGLWFPWGLPNAMESDWPGRCGEAPSAAAASL